MSWSVSLIGKPENVVARLKAISVGMHGQTKIEFDDALPSLCSLVEQNFDTVGGETTGTKKCIELTANGSGFADSTKQINRSCNVTIKNNYTELV